MGAVLQELVPAVKEALSYLDVRPGENALVVAEPTTNPEMIDAFALGCRNAGATVTTIIMEPPKPGTITDVLPPAGAALLAADAIVCLTEYPIWNTPTEKRRRELRVGRLIMTGEMANVNTLRSGGRFPMALFYEIFSKLQGEIIVPGKTTIRFTCPKGTDLTGFVEKEEYVRNVSHRPLQQGEFSPWPFGAWVVVPPTGASGRVVWSGLYMFGLLTEPITLDVKDGWVTHISGGEEARDLQEYIAGIENAYHLAEMGFGLNPWMAYETRSRTLVELQRRAGSAHVAIGGSYVVDSRVHLDGTLLRPTIHADGRVIVRDGKMVLFEDPEIRRIASKYGDPDKVFSHTGYLFR